MVIFWGASSEGNTYSLIAIEAGKINNTVGGAILYKKKVSYGAIDADVVNNRISLQVVDKLLYIYLNDEIQG